MKKQIPGPLWRTHVNNFLDLMCVTTEEIGGLPPTPLTWFTPKAAYDCYLDWFTDLKLAQHYHPVRRSVFDYAMEKLGYEKKRAGGETRWQGVRPKVEDEVNCKRCGTVISFFADNVGVDEPVFYDAMRELVLLRTCRSCICEVYVKQPVASDD